jgi:hypothetical protein
MSPFKALYGYDFTLLDELNTEDIVPEVGERLNKLNQLHKELQAAIQNAQESYKKYADRKRQVAPLLKQGDLVWLSTSNLKSQRPSKSLDFTRLGPFKIKERVNDLTFKLDLPSHMKIHDVFHVNLLEPYHTSKIENRSSEPLPPIEYEDDNGNQSVEYEVNEILDVKFIRNKIHYLVDWKGYGAAERSWEPLEHLENAQSQLQIFYERYPDAIKPNATQKRPSVQSKTNSKRLRSNV